jgi:hypothetical protein
MRSRIEIEKYSERYPDKKYMHSNQTLSLIAVFFLILVIIYIYCMYLSRTVRER